LLLICALPSEQEGILVPHHLPPILGKKGMAFFGRPPPGASPVRQLVSHVDSRQEKALPAPALLSVWALIGQRQEPGKTKISRRGSHGWPGRLWVEDARTVNTEARLRNTCGNTLDSLSPKVSCGKLASRASRALLPFEPPSPSPSSLSLSFFIALLGLREP
jgi:hypothetical protein